MAKNQTINEEAGLGPEWQPVDAAPIVPGQKNWPSPPFPTNQAPSYLQGSTPPGFQHDVTFVKTEVTSENVPKFSLMPLGVQGNPASNAALQSTAVKSVSVTAAAAATTDDDAIRVNLQTGVEYTVQSTDENKLISLDNASGGTVFLPPIGSGAPNPSLGGATQVASASDSTVTDTTILYGPYTPFDATQCVFAAIAAETPTGITPNGTKVFAGSPVLWLSTLTSNPTSYTATYGLGAGACVASASFDTLTGTATVVQANVGSATGTDPIIPSTLSIAVSMANAVIIGVEIIGVISGEYSASPPLYGSPIGVTSVTDDQGNVYKKLSESINSYVDVYGMGGNYAGLFVCIFPVGGPTAFSVQTFGNVITDAHIVVAEISGLLIANAPALAAPFWCYIENTGVGTFELTSGADIDGSSMPLPLTTNQGALLVYDQGGWYTERGIGSGGGGSTTFIGLTDVPASYSGANGYAVEVNSAATALQFSQKPFDVAVTAPGLGSNAQVLLRIKLARAVTFPAGAALSWATASAAAAASTTFTLSQNGTPFATINYAMSSASGVWTQASDAVFVAGDLLEIDGPAIADTTLADVGITLAGVRI